MTDTVTAILIALILILFYSALWMTFKKAGKSGWHALIPFYDGWVLSEIGGKPAWWGLLIFLSPEWLFSKDITLISAVSFICFILYMQICIGVARNFKKSNFFGIILSIIPFVGFVILGFGQAVYSKKGATRIKIPSKISK